mmetsp:Transcript_33979/g.66859  ORF Transcript_33979/g.66859 Transcript_33979/m.66859 type:complete len:230 (-) Transcript_33979:50-739(-)
MMISNWSISETSMAAILSEMVPTFSGQTLLRRLCTERLNSPVASLKRADDLLGVLLGDAVTIASRQLCPADFATRSLGGGSCAARLNSVRIGLTESCCNSGGLGPMTTPRKSRRPLRAAAKLAAFNSRLGSAPALTWLWGGDISSHSSSELQRPQLLDSFSSESGIVVSACPSEYRSLLWKVESVLVGLCAFSWTGIACPDVCGTSGCSLRAAKRALGTTSRCSALNME